MPRWIERRGYTLRLSPDREVPPGEAARDRNGREALVRLSLVERIGLVRGWYNVRETRAERVGDAEQLRALSDGRALSWRWLRHGEAERLLEARLGTLRVMGYGVIDMGVSMRGRWDWLYDLVHKRLAQPNVEERDVRTGNALEDALSRIGLSPDAIGEGIAAVLNLAAHELSHPDAPVVHRTDPAELGVLLPFLIHHEHPEIRAIGSRWFGCPSMVYQLPRDVLQRWLESDEAIARLLGPRLRPEGLALLGPELLLQLSQKGCTPQIREAARAWVQRLG